MIKIISCRKSIFFLISLFCLIFTQIARSGEANIIAFHITDAGMYMTIGVDDKKEPEKTFSMHQSTEPALTGDPPSLAFKDSPVKFFHIFWEKYEAEIRQLLCDDIHKKLPIKVYIAAAGTRKAATETIPQNKIIDHYLSLYPEEKTKICLTKENKLEFFKCLFILEIEKRLSHKIISCDMVPNANMIVEMASLHCGQITSKSNTENQQALDQGPTPKKTKDSKQSMFVAHMSTGFHFYRITNVNIKDDNTKDLSYFCLPTNNSCFLSDPWNIYKAGVFFKKKHLHKLINSQVMKPVSDEFDSQSFDQTMGLRDQIQLDKKQFEASLCQYNEKNNDHLLSAVYSADILHDAEHKDPTKEEVLYQGAPYMIYRLGRLGKGYNLFGDCVCDVLCKNGYACDQFEQRMSRIKMICPEYLSERACDQAVDLTDNVCDEFLEYIISMSLYNFSEHTEDNDLTSDPFVLIGDGIDLLNQYARRKKLNLVEILLQKLQTLQYVNKLFYRIKVVSGKKKSKDEFEKEIKTKTIPLIRAMVIVPKDEFIGLMHQTVLKHFHEKANNSELVESNT